MAEGYIRQLANYFKKNSSKGYTTESLKWALIKQGYSRTEVEKAIHIANQELAEQAPKLIEKPEVSIEQEFMPQNVEKRGLWQRVKGWFG